MKIRPLATIDLIEDTDKDIDDFIEFNISINDVLTFINRKRNTYKDSL